MMKKVSVIIPTYKRSDFLVRAINSVINQTYPNIEIIVVDDNDGGSIYQKKNKERLKDYIENHKIIYLQHDINKNGAAARNTGIKRATGDYVTFLDDDDFFLKNRIEMLVEFLERNSDYDCAYSSMLKIKNNHIYNYRVAEKEGNLLKETLSQYSFFGTGSNMFFTKKSINKIGPFDEKFFRFQDLEYMTRFFENDFKIGALNKILVVKCEEDNLNLPKFERLKQAKEMYIEKFKKAIFSFKENYNEIMYSIYKELYIFSEGKEHEIAIEILSKYKKIKLKDKIIYVFNKLSTKKHFFCVLNYKLREIRCIKKYSNYEREEIFGIIHDKN